MPGTLTEIDALMTPEHLAELRAARELLESPGLAIQAANLVGMPIEKAIEQLPAEWQVRIIGLTRRALEKSLDIAIYSIRDERKAGSSDLLHRAAVSVTGAAGGAFGLAALAVELPVSTTIMLRSIADIARGEGEDLAEPEAGLACMEVFALGGRKTSDDAAESAYYIARATLAKAVSEAAGYVATKKGVKMTAPPLIRFITKIAERFGTQVTQKAAAQAVPLVGAAGGALINNLFIDHFQSTARGHFAVRRLERIYGADEVEAQYRALFIQN